MFAMVFTVGAGYFLSVNNLKHTSDQAMATRLDAQAQEAGENLSLRVKLLAGGGLWLTVNNTGRVPTTLDDVFVTSPAGKLLSLSTLSNSSYLSRTPDLNVSLPLSLAPGASTAKVSGCGSSAGCDVKVTTAALGGGTPSAFLISVLTSLGNVFSVQYPTPSPTLKNILVINQNFVDVVDVGNSIVNLNNQQVIVNCYGCTTNLNQGGDILVAQVVATPSPVSDGDTITVEGTVWNYSPYTASQVNITLTATYAGIASVLPDISTTSELCGTTTTITTMSSASFACTFKAVSKGGATGGTVTFSGIAAACILTGTNSTCNGGSLTNSAEASSNPVQIGEIVTFGPWQLNYYFFSYTDKTHQTAGSPAVIAHGDQYVALYVQLTNIYNTSLTVLDGSYLQFVSPGTDVNAFIVENNTISYSSNSFTNYGCVDSPPSAPVDSVSGQNCITVAPGQSVTLAFAASAPAGSSWEWGSGGNPGGASNVGCTVQIIIEYDIQLGGTYSIYAENIPFQSVFIQ